jgi:hypothetical protein
VTRFQLQGGNHYLSGQPALVQQLADRAAAFAHAF